MTLFFVIVWLFMVFLLVSVTTIFVFGVSFAWVDLKKSKTTTKVSVSLIGFGILLFWKMAVSFVTIDINYSLKPLLLWFH